MPALIRVGHKRPDFRPLNQESGIFIYGWTDHSAGASLRDFAADLSPQEALQLAVNLIKAVELYNSGEFGKSPQHWWDVRQGETEWVNPEVDG